MLLLIAGFCLLVPEANKFDAKRGEEAWGITRTALQTFFEVRREEDVSGKGSTVGANAVSQQVEASKARFGKHFQNVACLFGGVERSQPEASQAPSGMHFQYATCRVAPRTRAELDANHDYPSVRTNPLADDGATCLTIFV